MTQAIEKSSPKNSGEKSEEASPPPRKTVAVMLTIDSDGIVWSVSVTKGGKTKVLLIEGLAMQPPHTQEYRALGAKVRKLAWAEAHS